MASRLVCRAARSVTKIRTIDDPKVAGGSTRVVYVAVPFSTFAFAAGRS